MPVASEAMSLFFNILFIAFLSLRPARWLKEAS